MLRTLLLSYSVPQCFQEAKGLFLRLVKSQVCVLNSLPNDKILDWFKLKAVADDKINLAEKLKPVLGQVQNVGKGENAGAGKGQNAGYQHFLLFPQCFQKPSLSGHLKVVIVWERVKGLFVIWHFLVDWL